VPTNLDPPTVADAGKENRRGVIYTIGPSYLQKGEIWAGTDDGLIQLTRDEGKTWSNVTPPEITPWSKVTHIEASHFDAGTAYAAVDRHRLEDLHAYLYRTRDFGKLGRSFERHTRRIFSDCVREDPARKGLLFACTEKGVFVSFDDGDHWQPLQLNLPTTSVRDLVIHENDLVIATHGRSFWILDDITPLRQLDTQVAQSTTWLFKPATAYRVRPGSDQGTPVPLDEPVVNNPPSGAVLDYFLRDAPKTPIKLDIFDAAGTLVRRFSSDDVLSTTKPEDLKFLSFGSRTRNLYPQRPGCTALSGPALRLSGRGAHLVLRPVSPHCCARQLHRQIDAKQLDYFAALNCEDGSAGENLASRSRENVRGGVSTGRQSW